MVVAADAFFCLDFDVISTMMKTSTPQHSETETTTSQHSCCNLATAKGKAKILKDMIPRSRASKVYITAPCQLQAGLLRSPGEQRHPPAYARHCCVHQRSKEYSIRTSSCVAANFDMLLPALLFC